MELTYYGGGCVLIANKGLNVLVDPHIQSLGLKPPKLNPDVVLLTTPASGSMPAGFVIDGPGEYEIKNVSIKGIPAILHPDKPDEARKGAMYTLSTLDVTILITGNIAGNLTEEQLEAIGTVNILAVPVGGHGLTLDATGAARLVTSLEPQFVIPLHYDDGVTKYAIEQDKLEPFVNEMGGQSPESLDKIKITGKDLETETRLVVLKNKT